MWKWSIYVALHLEDASVRERAVKHILMKNIPNYSLDVELFLVNDLKVPYLWIHETKALYAGYQKDYKEQVKYLLLCRCNPYIEQAHTIFVDKIASSLLINERNEELKSFLDDFSSVSKYIYDWKIRGGIYQEYFRSIQEFIDFVSQEIQDHMEYTQQLKVFDDEFTFLCDTLASWSLKDLNQIQLVCVCQMSTEVSNYLLKVKSLIAKENGDPLQVYELSNTILRLPIQESYRLNQLEIMSIDLLENFGGY
jgi:hypothetical protein